MGFPWGKELLSLYQRFLGGNLLPLSQSFLGVLVDFGQISFVVVFVFGGDGGLLGGPLLASLGLFLLGLAWFGGNGEAAEAAAGQNGVLPPPPQVEGNEVPHLVSLQQTDGSQSDQPEDESVVGSGSQVDDLLGGRSLGKAVPKGQ